MKLYPYQQVGVDFLRSHRRAYIGDEMGLGKTVQALVALRDVKSILAIVPAAAIGNWGNEYREWGNGQQFAAISYADRRLREGAIDGRDWGAVIMDEAHYLKSKKAKRTRYVFNVARDADRAIMLSGTPMPNHAGELWTMFDALWPHLLEDKFRTHQRWLNYFTKWTPTRYGPKVYGHQNAIELKRMLKRVMLRRKLADVALDLPELRVTLHTLPPVDDFTEGLTDEARLTLHAMREEEALEESSLSRVRRLLGALKAPMIAATLRQELQERQYQKIVVSYYHRDVGNILQEALQGFGLVRIDGKTASTKRQPLIDQFTNDSGTRVFLGQARSTGEALNLQAASEIALVEPDWVPDVNRQIIKRIHRMGQAHPCRARLFGVGGSLDEAVMKTLVLKTRLQVSVGLR